MFKSIVNRGGPDVTLHVDGRPVRAHSGETVAMALLHAGVVPFRHTPVGGQPRAPMCLMGVCFDCLVEIDGQQNVQSCMVEVRDGMTVRAQHGAREARELP
jgi:D-hydroxyproline dehydrogenase subunit gamma